MSLYNCTGACIRGGSCGRPGECVGLGGYSTITPPTFAEIQNFKNSISLEVSSIKQQVNAQEYTINHTQSGVEACFEAIEKTNKCITDIVIHNDLWIKEKAEKISNPFEFIAVDAKRRDDIRHIKNSLYELYTWILANVQDNKERSKGIERLEEAAMWLNKSISRRKENESQRKA